MNWTRFFCKTNLLYIFSLGIPYSVILVFSAYGPALHYISGPEKNVQLSSIFLSVLMVSMVIPSPSFMKLKMRRLGISLLIGVSALFLGTFTILQFRLQTAGLVLLGFTEGRIALLWSGLFLAKRRRDDRIFIITSALVVAYFILYLSNMVFPVIPVTVTAAASAVILLSTIFFVSALINSTDSDVPPLPKGYRMKTPSVKPLPVVRLLILIYIIYITAGFTYTVIFPSLRTTVRFYPYFNVLPFVLVLPFAGFMLHRYGAKSVLHIGITFLGISYLFYRLPVNNAGYFLVESFIQPGWAFLDLFVWFLGAFAAEKYGRSLLLPVFIAVFLFGTVSGAVVSIYLMKFSTSNSFIFLMLSLLPLLIVIPALNSINLSAEAVPEVVSPIPRHLLTSREYEIALLLADNRTQSEICSGINISINTLKTHTRNIYRKLGISSKRELISSYNSQRDSV